MDTITTSTSASQIGVVGTVPSVVATASAVVDMPSMMTEPVAPVVVKSAIGPDIREQLAARTAEIVAQIVLADIIPRLQLLTATMADLASTVNINTAQLVVNASQVGSKTSVASGRTARVGEAADADDPNKKIRNNMLFHRKYYMYSEEFRRESHARIRKLFPDLVLDDLFDADTTTSTKKPGEMGRLSAEAKILWGKYPKADKDEYKAQFDSWKTTKTAANATAPLTADAPGAVVAPAVMDAAGIDDLLGLGDNNPF